MIFSFRYRQILGGFFCCYTVHFCIKKTSSYWLVEINHAAQSELEILVKELTDWNPEPLTVFCVKRVKNEGICLPTVHEDYVCSRKCTLIIVNVIIFINDSLLNKHLESYWLKFLCWKSILQRPIIIIITLFFCLKCSY